LAIDFPLHFAILTLPLALMNITPQIHVNGHFSQPKSVLTPVGIVGLGHFTPERVLTNTDLESMVETSDEWIYSRTGIRERHVVGEGESTYSLALEAAKRALCDADLQPSDIDLIIVATCTPDYQFPSTAALVQDGLGAHCAAFDLEAACSGFVYALVTAAQFVSTGTLRNVLVIGAETMSRVLDWTDRNTCVLFGDGAGAAVLSAVPEGYGLGTFDLGADGSGGGLLKCGTRAGFGDDAVIYQNGREVYKFAVSVMGESAQRTLDKAGLSGEDIDLLVPHQANVRIIQSAANRLGLPMEKVFLNVEKYGNTSAASIPMALSEAKDQGRLLRGDTVAVVGFGAGLTWASAVLTWW